MKSNSKLVRAGIRLWPKSHGRYEEMCALAATAQLRGKEMSELNVHITTCDSCREFLWSLGQVSVQVMPLLAENGAPAADIVPPDGMRDRFPHGLLRKSWSTKSMEGRAGTRFFSKIYHPQRSEENRVENKADMSNLSSPGQNRDCFGRCRAPRH
jgi:hypothetical protein